MTDEICPPSSPTKPDKHQRCQRRKLLLGFSHQSSNWALNDARAWCVCASLKCARAAIIRQAAAAGQQRSRRRCVQVKPETSQKKCLRTCVLFHYGNYFKTACLCVSSEQLHTGQSDSFLLHFQRYLVLQLAIYI